MAPRTLGELISIITSEEENELCNKFIELNEEIFTHSKDEITRSLIEITDKGIFLLRDALFQHLITIAENTEPNDDGTIKIDQKILTAGLRKRYKGNKCFEDIYHIGLAIAEKSIQGAELMKIIVPLNNHNYNTTGNHDPMINSMEKAMITKMDEILDIVKALRKENKDLKEKMDIFNTKLENQNKTINELKTINYNDNNSKIPKIINGKEDMIKQTILPNLNNNHSNNENVLRNNYFETSPETITEEIPTDVRPNLQCFNNLQHHNKSKEIDINAEVIIQEHKKNELYSDKVRSHSLTENHEGKNEFTKITYKKKNSPVFGTRQPTKKSIAGERIIREINLFIGGVSNEVTENTLKEYMTEELNITPIKIVSNKRNNFNQSFKVTIKSTDKNIIFKPETWENNIVVKSFREKRYNHNEFERYGNPSERRQDIDNFYENNANDSFRGNYRFSSRNDADTRYNVNNNFGNFSNEKP